MHIGNLLITSHLMHVTYFKMSFIVKRQIWINSVFVNSIIFGDILTVGEKLHNILQHQ